MASSVEYRNKLYYDYDIGRIADAIRSKNGSSDTYTVAEMSGAIRNIAFELPANTRLACSTWSTMPSNIRITPRSTMSYMFYNCQYLTTAPELDTSSTTNMSSMFYQNTALTSVPLYNTSLVTNFHSTFNKCQALANVPLFDTSAAQDMGYMFFNCNSITSAPLLDMSSATDVSYMYGSCQGLTSVPSINTSSAQNMAYMFSHCGLLTDIPELDMSSVTALDFIFYECPALSNTSLQNILKSLLTATSYSGNKSLKRVGLSQAQSDICVGFPEWSTLSSNGWIAV